MRRFIHLLAVSQKRIYAYIYSIIPNAADAEDILQDTLGVMWSKFDSFQEGTNFTAWGVRIAYYNICNYKNSLRIAYKFNQEVIARITEQATATSQDGGGQLDALRLCVQRLHQKDRELIKYKYENNVSTRQMAKDMNRSLDGLYRTVTRIHKALAACVKSRLSVSG